MDLALCSALCACAREPTVTEVRIDPAPSTPPPPPVHIDTPTLARERAIDINFENKIHLVAVRIDPERAAHGERVRLTFTWRCDDRIDGAWQLLTHIRDDVTEKTDNIDFVGPLREVDGLGHQQLGPEHWEAGKTYVDTQTYVVPDWAKGTLTVFVGIWRGSARLHVVSGPNDGDNRAIAGKIQLKQPGESL